MARGTTPVPHRHREQLPLTSGPEWWASVAGAALVFVGLRLVSAVVILLAQRVLMFVRYVPGAHRAP